MRSALEDLRDAKAQIERMRGALDWYAEMAKMMQRATLHVYNQVALHILKEMALDGGKRAREARVIADRLTAELDKCAAALPGAYYMDQPDGGDVSVSEQLKRMAKDAERYRLLRRKFAIISDGEGHAEFCAINLPRPTYIAPSSAIELDTALDRERLGLDGSCAGPLG